MCVSLPARILEVDPASAEARVELDGRERRVSVSLLLLQGDPVSPGDWVLASAGLAVRSIGEDEARELAELHRAMDHEEGP